MQNAWLDSRSVKRLLNRNKIKKKIAATGFINTSAK
jgi:hypothetical protein